MNLTPDGYRLFMEDPKDFGHCQRHEININRPIKERLLLCYLFNRNQVDEEFIVEAKAPASPIITKFLITFSNWLNDYLFEHEAIEDKMLKALNERACKELKISVEQGEKFARKYEDYLRFLLNRPKKQVITQKLINEVVVFAADLEGEYENILESFYYREQATTEDPKNDLYYVLSGFRQIPVATTVDSQFFRACMLSHWDSGTIKQVPIDIINYFPKKEQADLYNIRILDYPLTEFETRNSFWFDIGMQKSIIEYRLPALKYTFGLFLIDNKGYTLKVKFKQETVEKYFSDYQEAYKKFKAAIDNRNYDTYPNFTSRTLVI